MTVEPPPNESYDWDAAASRLRAAAEQGDAPPAWIPEGPGAEIIGELVAFQPAVHTRNGPVPVATLRGPNGGHRSVWLHHAVLRRGFIRANVQLGERVLVRYLGPVEREGGNPWHDYRVVVDRQAAGGGPDWAAVARAHEDEDALELEPEQPAAPAPAAAPAAPAPELDARCVAGEHDYQDRGDGHRVCSRPGCTDEDIPF